MEGLGEEGIMKMGMGMRGVGTGGDRETGVLRWVIQKVMYWRGWNRKRVVRDAWWLNVEVEWSMDVVVNVEVEWSMDVVVNVEAG